MLKLVLITGMSGSGKSVALRVLEDAGYICVDNLPVRFLHDFISRSIESSLEQLAVAIDVRWPGEIDRLPAVIEELRNDNINFKVVFLDATDAALKQRYSESRRRHPLTAHLAKRDGQSPSLQACINAERDVLAPLQEQEHTIDTTNLTPGQLRAWVLDLVQADRLPVILTFESFAFKRGLPQGADLVFDVRCLPNPHYDRELRPLTGKDTAVAAWLDQSDIVQKMIANLENFIQQWLPIYAQDTRSYLTVAIGCTGGQHRSVYVAECLAQTFANYQPLVRHRNQPQLHV